ncbi:hypothetical protein Pint_17690 [Pistacia integerrima]|uniref:Uncharacterized protein n=1 Tax=Pistacia integerrima TaxID=434235 RepID=A0ACC0YZS0_9ROSI|nr:hypothetical protein Pint_17690 [Pistacia integerrima]
MCFYTFPVFCLGFSIFLSNFMCLFLFF